MTLKWRVIKRNLFPLTKKSFVFLSNFPFKPLKSCCGGNAMEFLLICNQQKMANEKPHKLYIQFARDKLSAWQVSSFLDSQNPLIVKPLHFADMKGTTVIDGSLFHRVVVLQNLW